MKINDFEKGLLLGDGSVSKKGDFNVFQFSSTQKELVDKAEEVLIRNNIKYSRLRRDYLNYSSDKENYEILDILDSYNAEFISYFKELQKESPINNGVIAGYLETKGSFFSYVEKRPNKTFIRWRISYSGDEEFLKKLQNYLEELGVITSKKIIHRKEREEQGIISNSYRLYINQFESINTFYSLLKDQPFSLYLREKFEQFEKQYIDSKKIEPRTFKHYKYAIAAMLKPLNLKAKGTRNNAKGTRSGYNKLISLYDEFDCEIDELGYGWEEAFKKVSEIYEEKTGNKPHTVDNNLK